MQSGFHTTAGKEGFELRSGRALLETRINIGIREGI